MYKIRKFKNNENQNLHLNEDFDFFGNFDDVEDNTESSVDDNIATMIDDLHITRAKSCGLRLENYTDKIIRFLQSKLGYSYILNEAPSKNRYFGRNAKIAVINTDGTVDIYGDLILTGLNEWPEYLYISHIYKFVDEYNRQLGSMSVNFCKFKKLPEGFPEEIDGDVYIRGCRNLIDLENLPTKIGGNLVLQLNSKDQSLKNNIKVLRGKVLTDNHITKEEILKNSIYHSFNESLNKLNSNSLNEAFTSDIFKRIFNKPENKKAVQAIKSIPMLWSEIKDEMIIPCYGGYDKIMKIRSVGLGTENAKNYGLFIACNKQDKIQLIMSGNNKNKYVYDNESGTWEGRSVLYSDPKFFEILNERLRACKRYANSIRNSSTYTEKAADKTMFEEIGIDLDDEAKTLVNDLNVSYNEITKSNFLAKYLRVLPDLIVKSYIMVKNDDETTEDVPSTFLGNSAKRYEISNKRDKKIFGTYVNGKNENKNSPLFKAHKDLIIINDTLKNMFNEKFDNYYVMNILTNMKDSILETATVVREYLITFYNDKAFNKIWFDILYKQFVDSNYLTVIHELDELLEKFFSNREDEHTISSYRKYIDDNYTKNKKTSDLMKSITDDSYSLKFRKIKKYIACTESLSALVNILTAYEEGDMLTFRQYIDGWM